jgi:hypothetical protein
MANIVRVSKPTHSLETVKMLAARAGSRQLTSSGARTASTELGMDREAVFAAVAALTSADFYKTMESESFPGRYQDVYRPVVVCRAYPTGVQVYCKVELSEGALIVYVISFKRK